jgi:hypothetical protein
MAFKGTDRRSAADIAVEIENVGGHLNAYTAREVTAYYARVLREDVPLAMDLLADILRAPQFEADEIAVERGVILQEIGQALDTPDDVIFDWLQEVSYPGQSMGRNILGEAERVSRFCETDLRAFTGAHYAPDRMILAAAGAVEHDEILKLAESLYGDMTPAATPALEPARFLGGEKRAVKPLEQAHLALAFEAPPRPTTRSTPPRSSPPRSAAACPRGCSRKRGRSAGSATPSSRRPRPMPTPAPSPSTPAPAPGRSAASPSSSSTRSAPAPKPERRRGRPRPRPAQGRAADGAREPVQPRRAPVAQPRHLGPGPDVAETVAKVEAVDVAAARAAAERICAAARPAVALYGPVDSAPGAEEIAARLAA